MKSPITNSLFARILTRGLSGLFVLGLFCFSVANAEGIADGFIHGYGFENSYADLTGSTSGRPLTIGSGTISFTNDGFIGQAVSIQDKGYVRMEDAYKTAFGIADGKDGKMTFLCWYNPTKFDTAGHPLTTNKDWKSGKNPGAIIDAQNSGAGGLRYNFGDGTDAVNITPDPSVPSVVGEWQFVAITADLSTNQANLYYGTANGDLQLKGTGNTSSIDSLLSNFNYWFIGIENSGTYYFNGSIDEAGYWNRALSVDEINQIYTAQKNGTSLASQINLASSATTAQAGVYTDASTWAGGVVPGVDANVEINHTLTSDSRTFNGEAVIGADGSLTATGCVYVGHSNDGVARLTINGGDNVFSGKTHNSIVSSLIIGFEGGNGEFVLNDGTVTTSGYTYVSYAGGGEAKFIQTGGTFNSGDNIGLAYHANEIGSMEISGGEMNVNGAIRIAIEANSTGQMTVSGGKVTATNFQIGRAGAGEAAKLTITGGVVEVTGAIYGTGGANSGNLSISGTGQLVFNSTTTANGIRELTSFQVEGSGSDGTGALLFKQSLKGAAPITLTGDTTIGIEPGATFTQTAAISGTSGLTITGGGTMELTANSTYTGATTVEAGTLQFSCDTLPVSAMTATGGTLVLGTEGNTITVKRGASITASGGAVRVDGNLVFESAGSGFVACNGSWTGSGSIKLDGGYIRVGTNFNTTTGIDFNGGSILNNNNDATLASDLTITKDGSTMQAGWKLSLTHTGALKGSASLTVGSDSGWLIFAGNGSNYQGSLLVKGNMRIGKANTDSSDCSAYIGSKVINLNGGTIQNNNNNLTITNDLNVMSETGFKTGWKKNITLTGNVTGSAKLKQVSDSGWLILQTHSDNDAFTGPFQTGWASTSSRGQTKLAAEQPLGANAGVLYNYGYLDMNGFSQKFKGVVDDGANNKKGRIYNTTANKSTVTFDITSQNLSYAGTIESNVELIINASGAGTQTFTNNTSNFTGNVTINGGTVKTTTAHASYSTTDLGAFTTTGGRTITVNAGAELVLGTNDILGGCAKSNFNENSVRLILNGGKLSGTNNNPLYNATFQNGAEVYGNNNRDVYRSFWLMGPNTVSFAGDGETAESPVRFNGADGVIFVLDSAALDVDDITKSDASDLVVNVILGNKSESVVANNSLTKTGAGTMELTAANTYDGGTTVSGGVLKLTGAGTLGSGKVTVNENGTLEFNVTSGPAKTVAVGTANKVTGTGQIVKTGDGTLKINAAQSTMDVTSLVVKEGRLDMKEYFTGKLAVNNGAAFSPGNSVGTLNLTGDLTLGEAGGGDYAQLIMEIGGATADKNDALIVTGDLKLTNGKIYLTLADACELNPGDEFSMILSANNSAQLKEDDFITTYIRSSVFTDLVYEPLSGGTFVISGTLDANAIPEPATWLLLLLGAFGLMYWRKRK